MTATTEKSTYHHGNLRSALLAAVGELILEKGVGGVSLRAAARRAGVSHAAPAHHFGDKLGMLTAFARAGFEEFHRRMQKAYDEAGDPVEALNAIGLVYIDFAMTQPAYFDVMFRNELNDKDDPELRQAAFDSFAVLTEAVEKACRSAELDVDPMVLAVAAWAKVHGLAMLWRDGALQMFVETPILELATLVFEAPELAPQDGRLGEGPPLT